MTKIKICGLKRTEDISYVNELLPDFAGFVFAKSSRQVDAKKTAELKKQLSPKIKAVGVFVNAEPEFIDKLYQKQIIDLAQLHGDETADYIHRLKKFMPFPPADQSRSRTKHEADPGDRKASMRLSAARYLAEGFLRRKRQNI